MTVYVVSRNPTYPGAEVVAVFSKQEDADDFVAKRDSGLRVTTHEVDEWIPA